MKNSIGNGGRNPVGRSNAGRRPAVRQTDYSNDVNPNNPVGRGARRGRGVEQAGGGAAVGGGKGADSMPDTSWREQWFD